MVTRLSLVLAALLFIVTFATPAVAQEAEAVKKEAAEKAEAGMAGMKAMQAGEMKGEHECQCACMQEGHAGMMEGEAGAHAHAEGEAQAAMAAGADAVAKEGHADMMKGCKCMQHAEGEEGGMQCRMHGAEGEMKGKGMQHRHGAEASDEATEQGDADG